ncbi:MAG: DUF494 domain-containing protein [Rhodoferax sp.]
MYDALVYVFENFWGGSESPSLPTLHRALRQVGFSEAEIMATLLWLEELKQAARALPEPSPTASGEVASLRVLSASEQSHLGPQGWGWLLLLQRSGALDAPAIELVIERAMALPESPVPEDALKLIVLMVFWSLGRQPDALMLDALCDPHQERRPN